MKNEIDRLAEQLLGGNILLQEAIAALEKSMIRAALGLNGGKHTGASKRLGIHRNTLQRKIVEYGIADGRPHAPRKPVVPERRTRKRRTGAA